MIAMIAATEMETRPLLRQLGAREIASEPFKTYSFAAENGHIDGVIVISGMGKQSAAQACEHLITTYRPTEVVNFGICGALSDELESGTLARISQVIDADEAAGDEKVRPYHCNSGPWNDLPSCRLASVTEPVFQGDRRLGLARRADVVDMEGAAIARICRKHRIDLHMIKGISDLADENGKEDIKKNIEQISKQVAEVVSSGLAGLGPRKLGVSMVLRFTKIEHTVLSLPLLLAGAWLGSGGGLPSVKLFALIALAGVGARTLGMSMNRIFDRKLDALNPRTASRELPSGRISLGAAFATAAAGLGLYLLACAALGPICLILSPIPAAALICYSLLKRFTSLCHFGIGFCLALAPMGAFIAASGSAAMSMEVWLLAMFTFCWMSGFDIIYAIQDIDTDRRTGVRSIPAAIGSTGGQVVAAIVHLAGIVAVVWLWMLVGGATAPTIALVVAIIAFILGYWQRLPIAVRFFPIAPIAGIAGSLVVMLGELG